MTENNEQSITACGKQDIYYILNDSFQISIFFAL